MFAQHFQNAGYTAIIRELLDLIDKIQWSSSSCEGEGRMCPVCDNYDPLEGYRPEISGHRANCIIRIALDTYAYLRK